MIDNDVCYRYQHFQRISKYFNDCDFLYQLAIDTLLQNLTNFDRDFTQILVVSDTTGRIKTALQQQFPQATIFACHICDQLPQTQVDVVATEGRLPFDADSFDLIISPLALHLTKDLSQTLAMWSLMLKPGGVVLANIFGGDSLTELKQTLLNAEIKLNLPVKLHILPLISSREVASILQNLGTTMPVVESQYYKVNYSDIFALMDDIRFMGQGGVNMPKAMNLLSKEVLERAQSYYQQHFFELKSNSIYASVEIINLMFGK